MTDLTIKWLIGDWPNKPIHKQGLLMLETSIRFSRMIFNDATRIISIASLQSKDSLEYVKKIGKDQNAEIVFAKSYSDQLPPLLANSNRRNAWWKYVPLKINPNDHNLILDNDFIIWRRTSEINSWLNNGGLLGYGVKSGNPDPPEDGSKNWGEGIHFGSKHKWVKSFAGTMALNGGLNGIGENVQKLPISLFEIDSWDEFPEDQAWWTSNFAKYSGKKEIIDYQKNMPVMYKWSRFAKEKITPNVFMKNYNGAHFTTHNAGWCQYYADYCHHGFDMYLKERGY